MNYTQLWPSRVSSIEWLQHRWLYYSYADWNLRKIIACVLLRWKMIGIATVSLAYISHLKCKNPWLQKRFRARFLNQSDINKICTHKRFIGSDYYLCHSEDSGDDRWFLYVFAHDSRSPFFREKKSCPNTLHSLFKIYTWRGYDVLLQKKQRKKETNKQAKNFDKSKPL